VWKWIIGATAIAAGIGAVAYYYPKWMVARDDGRTVCLSTIKRASTACLLYSNEFDGRLPMAVNWMDALEPHLDGPLRCPKVKGGYGYAFNDTFSTTPLWKARDNTQVLIFESTNLERNAHDPAESIPSPGRHKGRSFVVYTDSGDLQSLGKWARK
jgi:hypothetical protein